MVKRGGDVADVIASIRSLELTVLETKAAKAQVQRELNATQDDLIIAEQERKRSLGKIIAMQHELSQRDEEKKTLLQRLADAEKDGAKKKELETILMKRNVDNAKLQKEVESLKHRCDRLFTDKVATEVMLTQTQAASEKKDKDLILAKQRLLHEQETTRVAKAALEQSRRAELAANEKFRVLCKRLAEAETQRQLSQQSASQALASDAQRRWELEATQQVCCVRLCVLIHRVFITLVPSLHDGSYFSGTS